MAGEMKYLFATQLTERETMLIGNIVALWGAMEHEIFTQTLATFDGIHVKNLPKQMNNLQFTGVLALWKERVVDTSNEKRREVLVKQYEEIERLSEYRQALVHGMWTWDRSALNRISTVRVRKDEYITVHFDADHLNDFSERMGVLNYKIRYPGGNEDRAKEFEDGGGFAISREMLKMMSDVSAGKKSEEQ